MGAPRSRHTRGPPGRPDRDDGQRRRGRAVRTETDHGRLSPDRMLRIIHTADVHLGARHDDLGEQAAAQRERQFAAFAATVGMAIADKVDLVLIAGDLFDSNVQPRRSVQRVAAELKRLGEAKIRTVLIPGTHDCYDRASIYRAYDLKTLSGSTADDDLVTILTPDQPSIHLPALDTIVYGPVFATKRAPHSPLRDLAVAGSLDDGRRDAGRRADRLGARRCRACRDRVARLRQHDRARRARGHLADRPGPWLDRHPGQDGPRRCRDHDGRDRGHEPRLSRARALALGAPGQGRRRDVRLRRSAGGRGARPGPRRQGPSRRPRGGRRQACRDRHRAAGRQDDLREARASTPRPSRTSRPSSRRSGARRTQTSSSMRGSSASGPTSSTSIPTRSRRRSRRPSSRCVSATSAFRP